MEKELKNVLKSVKLNESTISTILGALVVVLVGVLIFNYFKSTNNASITPEAAQEENLDLGEDNIPTNLPTTHKVVSGESLWQVAEKYYGSGYNWVDVASENKLANANLIYVDQELSIPKVEVRKPDAQAATELKDEVYKVKENDSLWNIAVAVYADGYKWPAIAKVNNLTNPDYLQVGQELKLPR